MDNLSLSYGPELGYATFYSERGVRMHRKDFDQLKQAFETEMNALQLAFRR